MVTTDFLETEATNLEPNSNLKSTLQVFQTPLHHFILHYYTTIVL